MVLVVEVQVVADEYREKNWKIVPSISKRNEFFEQSGLPFWDAFYTIGDKKIHYPYALYTCRRESAKRISEIEKASILIAQVFEKVINRIKNFSPEELEKWCFDKKYADLLHLDWDHFFCFRAGWAFKNGQLKLLEINSQTPSFWFEPEMGNRLLQKQFGLKNPNPQSENFLEKSLNQAIKAVIDKKNYFNKKPLIGFITCNFIDDVNLVKWLASRCEYDFEVIIIDDLDFSKTSNIPFNRKTGRAYDGVLLWYPLEWLVDLKFGNGEALWPVFIDSLKSGSLHLVHALPAFFIQSKAILAYITKNAENIFTGKLKLAYKYFTRTYLNPDEVGKDHFAKPIWGREGRGSYLVKNGKKTYSRYQEDYYVKQKKVYQEILDIPLVKVEDKKINLIYESWVYRVDGKFVPGAVGARGSGHQITDDFSYWIPIGI